MNNDFGIMNQPPQENQIVFNNNNQYMSVEDAYTEKGFSSTKNNNKLLIPIVALTAVVIVGIIIFLVVSNSATIEKINVEAPSVVYIGKREKIKATSIGKGKLDKTKFKYTTTNPNVIELANSETLTGKQTETEIIPKKTGKATIYVDAELGKKKAERIEKEIIVCNEFNKEVLKKQKLSMIKNKTYNFSVDLGRELECSKNIEYKIENEQIATIDETGIIKALSAGATKIIITNESAVLEVPLTVINPKK